MDSLTRIRHAEKRIVKVQRRVWLAQVVMWPSLTIVGLLAIGGAVWAVRRSAGGRHEMPDMPGAHETGTLHVEPDGQLSDD